MVDFTILGPVCENADRHDTGGGAQGRASGALPGPKIDVHNDTKRARKVLQTAVATILTTPFVARVNFQIEGVSINKHLMGKVVKALENDFIDVKTGGSGKDFSASYSSLKTAIPVAGQKKRIGRITIETNSFCSGVERAGIFHECVHALMDVCDYKISQQPDEVFAYLADTLYMMVGKITMPRTGPRAPLHAAAYKIIRNQNMLSKMGVQLKWSDCDPLLEAVRRVPAYQNKHDH